MSRTSQSTTGPVSRHRLALGRIPGLAVDDTIQVPGQRARDFLASEKYCRKGDLSARQTINGIYLVQTVDWFLEFAPTDINDGHYRQQFWALVRDETGIDNDCLTPNNVELLYNALQDSRLLFKHKNRHNYPRPEKEGMTNEQTFFLALLDATRDRLFTGHSRFQLHYGLRSNDNFGERMASRVLQWRLRVRDSNDLLVRFPQIAHDILPLEKQDANFKKMAEKYALIFNEVAARTVPRAADDDAAILYTDGTCDSPITDMLTNLSLKLDNVKADLSSQARKNAKAETKLEDMAHGMYDLIHTMKQDMEQMAEAVEAMQEKLKLIESTLSKLAADMHSTKANVSLMFRASK